MNKMLLGLLATTGVVGLVLLGFLLGSTWNKPGAEKDKDKQPGQTQPVNDTTKTSGTSGTSNTQSTPSTPRQPPPPPPPVLDEVRVRESLKPGKTYRIGTRLAFSMRGTDHDWGVVNTTITVNYMADAEIDRKIVSNDGKTIVELRTFKKVHSSKLDTKLENVNIDLGAAGDFLVGGVALLQPEAVVFVAGARQLIEGRDLSKLLNLGPLGQELVEGYVQADPRIRAFTSVGSLQGKTARLTYRNEEGGGVQVDPVDCSLSEDEKEFLASSVLLSDSLIFPDVKVRENDRWEADSMYFIGLIDPSLMLRPEGKLHLQRGPNITPPARSGQKQKCVQINVTGGKLSFHESNSRAEQVGEFRPQKSEMVYSPQDQIFIQAFLHGKGYLTITQKDHILFQARSKREPELKVHYTCRILDNADK